MTRKLLAAFLALCMLTTLTPFAFAADTTTEGSNTNTEETQTNAGGGYSTTDIAVNNGDDSPQVLSGNVATVDSKSYTDIDEALTYWATNGGTLKLLQNAEFPKEGADGKKKAITITASNAVLDLNGKKLTASVSQALTVKGGQLTIKGDQDESVYESTASAPVWVEEGGSVTLESGTITAPGGTAYGVVGVKKKDASFVMNGGTINCTGNGYGLYLLGATESKRNSATINGGTITSVAEAIYMKDSTTLQVNGTPVIGKISVNTSATRYIANLEINGGIIDDLVVNIKKLGTFTISESARFKSDISKALTSTTYSCVKTDDGYYKAQVITADNAKVSVSSTDGTEKYYGSLVDAAKAITSGQTLKLLDDYTGSEVVAMNSVAYGVTVDLNGHSITNTGTTSDAVALKMQAAGTSSGGNYETAKIINTSEKTATLTGQTALGIHATNGLFTVSIGNNINLVSTGSAEKIALTGGAYLQEGAVNLEDVNAYWKTADGKLLNDFTYASNYNSGEISLVKDYTGRAQIKTSATVNLNGHTYTYTGSGCIVDLYSLAETDTTAMSLSIKKGTIRSEGKSVTGIMTSGNQTDVTVSLDGVTLSVPNGRGIFFPSAGSLTINDSVIEGKYFGVQMCAGSLTVSGDKTEITATGTPVAKIENDGPIDDGAAISIVNRTGYKGLGKVSIQDGAFKSNNSSKSVKAYSFNNTDKAEGAWNDAASTVEITGGHYTSDPSAYVKSTEAAPRYVVDSTKEGYSYMVTSEKPGTAPVIVADKTETANTITNETAKNQIDTVIDNANVDGVAEAITSEAKDTILEKAGVDAGTKTDSDTRIIVDVSVKVSATAANVDAENKLTSVTFEATPTATVTTVKDGNTTTKKSNIEVPNTYLSGQAITVKLPLPDKFVPKQIKHICADGSVEYFLDHYERGAQMFTVDADNCAVFTITKFSTFEVSGTQDYVAPSSGSGSSSTNYNVNVNAATNGTVTADKKTAAKGTTVTITATPSTGYVVDSVKVVDKDGKTVDVTAKDGKYSFVMPASAVTVTATFKAETPAPSGLPFTDVKEGDWFYGAVKYAYENGLMNGTGETTFAPNGTMNRAMIVTVLYRLEKSPAVTTAAKFTDVPAGQWYSDAVAWAAANNIVNGYDETTFGPMNAVTREQMAAILFRYEQYKGMDTVTLEDNLAKFPDKDKISGYAVPALNWAVGQKVINGNADGTLDPTGTATRAQVAQIFTNLLNK